MYPGFVFGFKDNITAQKQLSVVQEIFLSNPTFSDCTHAVKPLSAFCLWLRLDAKPGKAVPAYYRNNPNIHKMKGMIAICNINLLKKLSIFLRKLIIYI